MTRVRRSFTTEVKAETVALVVDKGYSIAEACAALDIGPTALRRWVKQYQSEVSGVTPTSLNGMIPSKEI